MQAQSLSRVQLCDLMDWPTRLLCPWDFPSNNTRAGCHFLLQSIFPTQESNPVSRILSKMLYHLSHPGIKLVAVINC